MRNQMPPNALKRRTVLTGPGIVTVAAALPGCGTADQATPAAGTTLGSTSQVPVGAGSVFAQQAIVVTQPSPGEFHAFSAICTHQGCLVQDVNNGTINCPCHGSRFDITNGSVVRGPAQQPLPRRAVTVEDTSLKLA